MKRFDYIRAASASEAIAAAAHPNSVYLAGGTNMRTDRRGLKSRDMAMVGVRLLSRTTAAINGGATHSLRYTAPLKGPSNPTSG